MEILNSSINEIADTFLHPGYMSAYVEVTEPGAMTAAIVPVDQEPVKQIDMVQALRLTPELRDALTAAPPPVEQSPAAPALLGVALLATAVAVARSRYLANKGPQLLGIMAALSIVLGIACAGDPVRSAGQSPPPIGPSSSPPHASTSPGARTSHRKEEVPFEHPRAATEAILHGIVADALVCSQASEIKSLATVKEQVGLPTANKTAGMRWAIANYEDDGWGRPLQFREVAKDQFAVTSAAEDGAFGTPDDISIQVRRATVHDWPSKLGGYYLRRERDDVGVSYHRCGATRTRRTARHWTARGLIGDELFGVIREQDFPEPKRIALRERIERVTGNPDRDALVLVVYDPRQIGRLVPRQVTVPKW